MLAAPISERTVTFALASGKTWTDRVEWHDLDFGDSRNKAGPVRIVDDDLNVSYFGNRLAFRFVRPKKRRTAAFSAASDEAEKLARLFS
jgi:hypothetical protein